MTETDDGRLASQAAGSRRRLSGALRTLGVDTSTLDLDTHDADEDGENHDKPLPFYAPPVQRQRWGEDQVLPHVNWGDVFFDLFYVGLATNTGTMLASALLASSNDLLRGIIYYIGCFGPIWNSWETSMSYTSRYTTVDYAHRLTEVVRYLFVCTAIVNIGTVDSLYSPRSASACAFCIAVLGEALMKLLLGVELYWRAEGDRGAIVSHTGRMVAYELPTMAIYVAAASIAAVLHVKALAQEDLSDAVSGDVGPRPVWDVNDLPLTLLVVGYLQNLVGTYVHALRATNGKHGDIRSRFVPQNTDFAIQRYGDWSLLMIGEGVVSLLIVDTVPTASYYLITIFGTLTMMFIQILKFESEPHRSEEHALLRSFTNAMCYSYLMQIFSMSLIAFGPTYKIYLLDVVAESNLLDVAAESIPREIAGDLFCWGLTAVLLSLELMNLTHSGVKKSLSHLTKPGAGGVKVPHWPMIIIMIFKLLLVVFTFTLQYWCWEELPEETMPLFLTLCGCVIVLAMAVARVAEFNFIYRKHVLDKLTGNFKETMKVVTEAVNPLNLVDGDAIKNSVQSTTETMSQFTATVKKTTDNAQNLVDGMFFSWGKLAAKPGIWIGSSDDGLFDLDERMPRVFQRSLSDGIKTCATSIKLVFLTAFSTPSIVIITLLTLATLLAISLAMVQALADAHSSELRVRAIDTAEELGMWISSQLDEALLPLFTMSQFVKHLGGFKQLPHEIAAVPPLIGKETAHRNVAGICDDPHTQELFNNIAANIKRDAGLEGILVNLQLVPHAVVCLLHPLINTEDFPPGIVMNNTGAVGLDLLNSPSYMATARATVPSKEVVVAGPLSLVQGGVSIVKEAFVARLAINMEGYNITVDGVDYPCWGFTTILLNWAALKEKAGIDQRFSRQGMEYRLTRTDWKANASTGELYPKVITIAESARSSILHEHNSVFVDLDTTNNLWVMTVGYEDGFAAPWIHWFTGLVVVLSVLVSFFLLTVLVANKQKEMLLYRMMPPKVIQKLQRGETVVQKLNLATVFFSTVVGFTKLGAELTPIDVMDMLNEMYSAFDALVEKHKLYKVDTCGDAYIVVGGMNVAASQGRSGAERVALFALDALEACKGLQAKNEALVCIRVGLASGPVVAGVVGKTMPKFTLFGDTVNFASQMESTSVKMRIQCSDTTYRLLRDAKDNDIDMEERIDASGEVGVVAKGKGRVGTWFINGAKQRTVVGTPFQ